MKKVLSALILTSLLVMPAIAFAADNVKDAADPDRTAPTLLDSGDDLIAFIENIGNWTFAVLLGVAGIFLIVSGFYFVTAGGNPENITKARGMLINALIGVAIALGAKGMVEVIGSLLGWSG